MISTAHIPFINKKPTEVFSTKFIVAPKRLNDEFSCVNTEHLPTTSQKEKSTNNTDDKIKKKHKSPTKLYPIFLYLVGDFSIHIWGTFRLVSAGNGESPEFIYNGLPMKFNPSRRITQKG